MGRRWEGVGQQGDEVGRDVTGWDGVGQQWDGVGRQWDGMGRYGTGYDVVGRQWDGVGRGWDSSGTGLGRGWDTYGSVFRCPWIVLCAPHTTQDGVSEMPLCSRLELIDKALLVDLRKCPHLIHEVERLRIEDQTRSFRTRATRLRGTGTEGVTEQPQRLRTWMTNYLNLVAGHFRQVGSWDLAIRTCE